MTRERNLQNTMKLTHAEQPNNKFTFTPSASMLAAITRLEAMGLRAHGDKMGITAVSENVEVFFPASGHGLYCTSWKNCSPNAEIAAAAIWEGGVNEKI